MDEFRAGVTAVLKSWSALRMAVESGWGGVESQRKAEDLRKNIFDHFDGSSVPPKQFADVMDLEDALAIYMEEEYSLTLEDGSEKQISDVIWRLYETCAKGDLTLAHQVVQTADQAVAQSPLVTAATVIQSPEYKEEGDDDDDGEDDDNDEEMMDTNAALTTVATPPVSSSPPPPPSSSTTAAAKPLSAFSSVAEYASQPLFGPLPKSKKVISEKPLRQLGEAAPMQKEPVMDEDGFAPVVSGKKKSKSRKPV